MNRAVVPWMLLAALAVAWAVTTRGGDDDAARSAEEQVADLEQQVEALRVQVQRAREARAPAAEGAAPSTAAAPQPAPGLSTRAGDERRDAQRTEARADRERRMRRDLEATKHVKAWLDAVRSLKAGKEGRAGALRSIRAALDAEDEALRLAGLRAARWLGKVEYDKADFRRAILPHATNEDPDLARAALEALAFIEPHAEDIPLWVREVERSDQGNAETAAQALTRVASGRIEGAVADAVLHLLRDGTRIKKAFVMRGLQSATYFEPRVEARLIEIVRSVDPHDYDSHYFFHFLAPRMDPKSDAVVELILDVAGAGKSELGTILRGLRRGLSPEQRLHAADTLMAYAENAPNSYTLQAVLQALDSIASARHVARLEALLADEDLEQAAGPSIRKTIEAARRRP